MTQTISLPEEISTPMHQAALKPHERRTTIRKAPEQLIYLSLPSNNGGIVLDVSEGGLSFHSIAPVDRDGPVHFRFAMDSGSKVRGVGEIAWIDKTRKTGGLRFTQLPDELREQIRLWTGQSEFTGASTSTRKTGRSVEMTSSAPSKAIGLSAEDSALRLSPSSVKRPKYSVPPEAVAPVSQIAVTLEAETRPGAASLAGTRVAEPVKEARILRDKNDGVPATRETRKPLLYNSTPPIYSAPFNKMSLFPLNSGPEADAAVARMHDLQVAQKPLAALESAARTNPFSAILLTALLAFCVTVGIFSYLATSGVGELLLSWGQESPSESQSQPALRNTTPHVNSAPSSIGDGGQ
jgi:hypothetical protein